MELIEVQEIVHRAAVAAAAHWPEHVEADDVEQGVMLRLLESPAAASYLSEVSLRERDRAIRRLAYQVASAEALDYMHFSGQYVYSTKYVDRLLRAKAEKTIEGLAGEVDLEQGRTLLEDKYPRYAECLKAHYDLGVKVDRRQKARALAKLTVLMNTKLKERSGK